MVVPLPTPVARTLPSNIHTAMEALSSNAQYKGSAAGRFKVTIHNLHQGSTEGSPNSWKP